LILKNEAYKNFSQRSQQSSDRCGLPPRRLIVAFAARNKKKFMLVIGWFMNNIVRLTCLAVGRACCDR
jgi:hypothetical protein